LRFSIAGFKTVWKNEAGFRQEATVAAVLIPLALWLGEDNIERVLLIGACLLVLLVEIINSAIEAAVDRVGTEEHPLSAAAKDMGSAAVMLSELMLVIVWALVLI
jgi:diacylglycerol kinase (ATP)